MSRRNRSQKKTIPIISFIITTRKKKEKNFNGSKYSQVRTQQTVSGVRVEKEIVWEKKKWSKQEMEIKSLEGKKEVLSKRTNVFYPPNIPTSPPGMRLSFQVYVGFFVKKERKKTVAFCWFIAPLYRYTSFFFVFCFWKFVVFFFLSFSFLFLLSVFREFNYEMEAWLLRIKHQSP